MTHTPFQRVITLVIATLLSAVGDPLFWGVAHANGSDQLPLGAPVERLSGTQDPGLAFQKAAPDFGVSGELAKIDSRIGQVLLALDSGGLSEAMSLAESFRLDVADGMVEVLIIPEGYGPSEKVDEAALIALGGTIENRSRHLLRVRMPLASLPTAAKRVSGLGLIVPPASLITSQVTSEGVAKTNADTWHAAGFTGDGVRIAIFDTGFRRLDDCIADGELPSTVVRRDMTGNGLTNGSQHGTAVAEIVHDMAPDAQLYLYRATGIDHIENAVDDCIAENIDIINLSGGLFVSAENLGFYDGTGQFADLVELAESNGMLWVNSAGNYATQHNEGTFTDSDGDSWHEFEGTLEWLEITVNAWDKDSDMDGLPDVYLNLAWDGSDFTAVNYDLYLADDDLNEVARSANFQPVIGPYEIIDTEVAPGIEISG